MPLAAVHVQAQHGQATSRPQAQKPCVVRKSSDCSAAFTETQV